MQGHDKLATGLHRLAGYPRPGLICDMDGTLSPIVPVPADARPTARNRDLLRALHLRLALVAVVSGRAADDVRDRVGLPELVYVGNHGLEHWAGDQVVTAPEVAPYLEALAAARAAVERQPPPGVWVEDKGATLSVHYRMAPDPQRAAAEFRPVLAQIADEHGLRVFEGRMIFELRPPVDIDKGTTLRHLVERYRLDAALYAGDDTTDVDALKTARTLRETGTCYALGVGVDSDGTPDSVREAADFLVDGVPGVEALLAALLDVVSASST